MKLLLIFLCMAFARGYCPAQAPTELATSGERNLSARERAKQLPEGYKFEVIPAGGAPHGDNSKHQYVLTLPTGKKHVIFSAPATRPSSFDPKIPTIVRDPAPVDPMVIAAIVDGDWFAAAVPGQSNDGWLWLRWNVITNKAEPVIFFQERYWTGAWPKFISAHKVEYRRFDGAYLTIGENFQVFADGKPRSHAVYGSGWVQAHGTLGEKITRIAPANWWPGASEHVPKAKQTVTIILRPDTDISKLPKDAVLDPLSPPMPKAGMESAQTDEANAWPWWLAGIAMLVVIALLLVAKRRVPPL